MKRNSPTLCIATSALLLALGACSNEPTKPASGSAGAAGAGSGAAGTNGGSTGAAGSTSAGTAGNSSAAGTGSGSSGTTGTLTGTAGDAAAGVAGTTGAAGTGTATGTGGATAGTTGAAGSSAAGTTGAAGSPADSPTDYPPPPRPINVTSTRLYNGGGLRFDPTKTPIMGKLILYLGGICGGTGAGGIESFVNQYGFHTYAPATQTCVNSAPQMYKDIIAKTPLDPEANRQVADARMELWDGVDRVSWVTVAKGASILEETIAALKDGMTMDPGSDWGYFLNADGTLRTSDVWVVGYSWGSQTWGMISAYVPFGRVICTSGPQAEGFPNGTWITMPGPHRTTPSRQFTLLGFDADYPSMDKIDIAPNDVQSMIMTTTAAGWLGPPLNVHPGDMGPFGTPHQIAMVEPSPYGPHTPGGHTVFCTGDPMNGWLAICKYAFNVQ
jgi:hypothetical protein